MKRYGTVIGLATDKVETYRQLHAAVWPEVLAMIRSCHMANYSIFLKEPENLLFGYFEYHGSDFAADMARMAADAKTQAWWALCMPCQRRLDTAKDGEWWASTEEVFHMD